MRILALALLALPLSLGCVYDDYGTEGSPGRGDNPRFVADGGSGPRPVDDGGPGSTDGGNPLFCVENMDCPEGCLCINNQCVEPGQQPGCTSNDQCEAEHFCDMSIGECVPVPEPECSELGSEQACIDDLRCQPVFGSNNCTPTDGSDSCTVSSATCVCMAPFFYAACIDAP